MLQRRREGDEELTPPTTNRPFGCQREKEERSKALLRFAPHLPPSLSLTHTLAETVEPTRSDGRSNAPVNDAERGCRPR